MKIDLQGITFGRVEKSDFFFFLNYWGNWRQQAQYGDEKQA